MTPLELLNRFRLDVRDAPGDGDQLWTDAEIYSYMDDAQKMFCRLTGGIADSSSAVTQIIATAGEEFGDISDRILKIRYAKRASDYREVQLLNFEDIQFGARQIEDYGTWTTPRLDATEGLISALITGMEARKVRFYLIPEADETINLTVYRLPLEDIEGATSDLEIDSLHHTGLLHWMKHMAYSKQDAETFDKTKAEQFALAFERYCAQARNEREKREHKYRTVGYGGL